MTSWAAEFRNEFQGRRVIVTGATGFIGKHLCQALVSLGADVTGLSRSASASNVPYGVTPTVVDLCRREETEAALAHICPDVIIHLAGYVTARPNRELVMSMFEANTGATVRLLVSALELKCHRFLLVSSSEASEAEQGVGLSSPYAASKLAAEIYGQMCYRLYRLPVVCPRPFLTYGPGQDATKLIPYIILTLLRGENPSLANADRVCDAIYVEDVVRGLLMACVAPANVLGEQFDLGTGKGITIRELVETVVKLLGSPCSPVFGAVPVRPNEGSAAADLERTQCLLGWTPRWSLEEGLRNTVLWYRQQGELESRS